MPPFRIATPAALVAAFAIAASAQTAAPVTRVVLHTGDILTGRLISESEDQVVLEHPAIGVITLPRGNVAQVFDVLPDADTGEVPMPDSAVSLEAQRAAQPEPAPEASPAVPEEKSPWTGSVEMGLNGSEGNTENFNLLAAIGLTRDLPKETLELKFRYIRETSRGDLNENEFTGLVRQTWKLDNPRWGVFVEGFTEYNEFERYDWLLRGTVGLSYKFIDRENETLIGRIGVGASYEINSPRDEVYPNGLLGVDYTREWENGVGLALGTEFVPDFGEFGEFELRSYAALDFALGNSDDWKLRTGVRHKYQSLSGPAENNDLDYFASLVYEF